MNNQFTIVTVVYGNDISLLKTQAESIKLYVDPAVLTKIIIVVNDTIDIVNQIDTDWYGHFSPLVEIHHKLYYSQIEHHNGWESQQLYKLLASAKASTNWAMVLDAKTWFINPVLEENLFSNNRYNVDIHDHFHSIFFTAKDNISRLFNIEFHSMIGPSGVPFMFNRQLLADMIKDVENITEQPFDEYFLNNQVDKNNWQTAITEFYLYSGYLLKRFGNYELYYNNTPKHKYANIADFDLGQFNNILSVMQEPITLTASIHPRAYNQLSDSQKQQWHDFLISKGLDNISYS